MRVHSINVDSKINGSLNSEDDVDIDTLRKSHTQADISPGRRDSLYQVKTAAQNYFQMFGSRGISFFSNIFLGANEQDLMNIDQLYEKAGCGSHTTKLGLYQKLMIFLVTVQVMSAKSFFFGYPFLTKIPDSSQWMCNKGEEIYEKCSVESVCNIISNLEVQSQKYQLIRLANSSAEYPETTNFMGIAF